ncbi:MAG TPA: hypothetical protein VLZ89_02400 [Anaerolineales bacterium]|nr:hypothetical protein [Anaerolineales bacterium]
MTSKSETTQLEKQRPKVIYQRGTSNTIYGLGVIGAWVYYIGRASTPRARVLGFFKGIFWPAILVYKLLKFFHEELTAPLPQPSTPTQLVPSKPLAPPTVRPVRKAVRSSRPKKKAVRK